VQQKNSTVLSVVAEEDVQELLSAVIVEEDIYQRQGDNIITWTEPSEEPGTSVDLALSFQDNAGCIAIWQQICKVQGRFSDFQSDQDAGPSQAQGHSAYAEDEVALPPAATANLVQIEESIANAAPHQKERIASLLLAKDQEYLTQLFRILESCEDVEDTDSLFLLFKIFKAILLLNESNLIEILMSDAVIFQVAGAFEYDPQQKKGHGKHRQYLEKTAKFKQVVPIRDPQIVARIHQNFRVLYFKDQILKHTCALDDAIFQTLNHLKFFNDVEIVTQLIGDSEFIEQLFEKMKVEAHSQEREDASLLLEELCNLARNLQIQSRNNFYRVLLDNTPFFETVRCVLADEGASQKERYGCLDILCCSLNHNPEDLRKYIVQAQGHPPKEGPNAASAASQVAGEKKDMHVREGRGPLRKGFSSLLSCLVQLLSYDTDTGVLAHASEVFRILLDPEEMDVRLKYIAAFARDLKSLFPL
jgi:protein phosphatase-4 regulatory subunit 3